jgi:BT1 family
MLLSKAATPSLPPTAKSEGGRQALSRASLPRMNAFVHGQPRVFGFGASSRSASQSRGPNGCGGPKSVTTVRADRHVTLANLSPKTPAGPQSSTDLRRAVFLVCVGLLITSLGQPGVIGGLPFRFLFKNQFHLDASEQANFFAVATFAWYLKPVAGLLCDSFPILGTRRRSYLLLSSLAAGATWALFAVVPRSYAVFLTLMVALNCAMVFASTSIGGILVEVGHRGGATGRLTSARYAIDGVVSIIAGPLGGWLATCAFGWTAGIGTVLLGSLVPATMRLLQEAPDARRNLGVWATAAARLRIILGSRTMWAASALLLLVYIAPGFGMALTYYQQDVLGFSTVFIGHLQALSGFGGIAASALYAVACRRLPLKPLLLIGILLNSISSLLYIGYRTPASALIIDTANGFLSVLGILPLFDLAARATPKGSESFGYALLMSVYNLAVVAISNPVGAALYELPSPAWHHNLNRLVWLNTATSLIALVLLPAVPRALLVPRERHFDEGNQASDARASVAPADPHL